MKAAKMSEKPIYVTQPFLPPLEEFLPYLESIWTSRILTNGGPFHKQFEQALAEHLGVDHLALFVNGTIALVTALQALRISGEVITTPYSFVATSHALVWNNIEPVFVDIDPTTLNIDPARIVAAITPRTTAILAVHCYGNPCNVSAINEIADTFNLKVIYDAAHAFGISYKGDSLLSHGDLSVLSFHATKVFNTFEGGAIICPDAKTKQHVDHLKNFGFVNETTVVAAGINGKMNEFQAALGLLQLEHIDRALERRKQIASRYMSALGCVSGIRLPAQQEGTVGNFAYFPVFVEADYPLSRDDLYLKLRQAGIYARRYFYPLISEFPVYRSLPSASKNNLPEAFDVSSRILCLPIYPDLTDADQSRVIACIKG